MKNTKKQAGYRLKAKRKLCKHCAYFQSINNSCSYVKGNISPNASCNYWQRI